MIISKLCTFYCEIPQLMCEWKKWTFKQKFENKNIFFIKVSINTLNLIAIKHDMSTTNGTLIQQEI